MPAFPEEAQQADPALLVNSIILHGSVWFVRMIFRKNS